jgi:hypothetical protein
VGGRRREVMNVKVNVIVIMTITAQEGRGKEGKEWQGKARRPRGTYSGKQLRIAAGAHDGR